MKTVAAAARREFALVFALAAAGVALVLAVAFLPWYEQVMAGDHPTSVVVSSQSADGVRHAAPVNR